MIFSVSAVFLSDFLGKAGCQLAAGIELSTADQVWQILLALVVQTMEEEILAVEAKCLSRYAEGYDFEVGGFRDNATSGHIPEFIHTICGEMLADSKDSDVIYHEVAHK